MSISDKMTSKVMTASEAVSKFVHDGDHVTVGNFLHGIPFAIVHEIVRQKRRNLFISSQSSIEEIEYFIAGGCTTKVLTSYQYRAGGEGMANGFERAIMADSLEWEDYSNLTVSLMFKAGAMGYSFMPALPGIMASDIYKIRNFKKDKFAEVKCPFSGKTIPVVPALNPDVALVHVQRADEDGNAQYWGSLASTKWACLAAKTIIVSCESIVPRDVIMGSPQYTLVPGFRVSAVVEEPWGAHPAELCGHYDSDMNFRSLFFFADSQAEGLQEFMKEWVYGVQDRRSYIDHYVERFGIKTLLAMKAKPWPSVTVDYGSAFRQPWDAQDYSRLLQMTWDEYHQLIDERGELL